ncbi:MAG: hypothetical protein H6706_17090 [Myxococcales bacterium]|nr:hypothetical protein [Myxococcales bacterium]
MRAALIALAATAAPTLAQADVFPLGDRQGVTFNQIAYELPEGPATSAWGRVTVDPARVARLTGESAGFVSVRTDLGWVALNLPVQLDPEFPRAFADATIVDDGATLPVSFEFSLGAERERASLDAAVVFSTTPLLGQADLAPLATLPPSPFQVVKVTEDLVTGVALDFEPPSPGGLPPPPPNPQIELPAPLEGYWARMTPNPVNVNAGKNQCAPIAIANAFEYLRLTFGSTRGFATLHDHVRGVLGDTSLAAAIDSLARRDVADTCNGDGIDYCIDSPIQTGLFSAALAYLSISNDVNRVHVRYQGDFGDSCSQDHDVKATDDGPEVTFEWICDRIDAGDAVVLTRHKKKVDVEAAKGQPIYPGMFEVIVNAHAIRVHGCGVMGGRPFLRVLNDPQQDKDIDGACTERDGLTSELVFVEDLDYDGVLNYGSDPNKELAFAFAVSIDP